MTEPNSGDNVTITLVDEKIHKGMWMPRPEIFSTDKVVLKLNSGYNIGIEKKNIKDIHIDIPYTKKEQPAHHIAQNKSLKKITILHSGGTIASLVDYQTGGVVAKYDPQEFLQLFPELQTLAQIDSKIVCQLLSEDIEPEHWKKLAEAVEKEYQHGAHGIIITHGTDTLHYTVAALSFMLQNLPVPVLLVGSQRSPDRGSSDAYMNMHHAVKFLAETDFIGVAVCMHGSIDDEYSLIHPGTKVKKVHTSRRDTFRTINAQPIAKVTKEKIEYLREYTKTYSGKFHVLGNFDKKVGIIKVRPGISSEEIQFYEQYHGLVIEGTGLGNMPVDVMDEYTQHHAKLLALLREMAKKTIVVVCSQCLYGSVDLHVYAAGRQLLHADLIEGKDMTPETAYIKLGWLLGNFTHAQAKEMINKNLAGEISERQGYGEL